MRWKLSTEERFMSKVVQGVDLNDCWGWIGSKYQNGRARFSIGTKWSAAARHAYTLFKGSIGNFHVLHTCDNPVCNNPRHLFLGTHQDNIVDMLKKGRNAKGAKVANLGSRNPAAKLNEAQVDEIRALLNTRQYSQTIIGKMFNVSQRTISTINCNINWKKAK